jgi:hypothetical protein
MSQLHEDFDQAKPTLKLYRPPLEVHFNPAAWASAAMMDLTGPYAYALNLPSIAECLVGNLLMKPHTERMVDRNGKRAPITPHELATKLQSDGLHYLGDTLPKSGYVIAFFLKPETSTRPSELICARRDSNHLWSVRIPSRKGGCNKPYQPSQKDLSDRPMKNILKADFGVPVEFLGYGSVPYEGVVYYRRSILSAADMQPFHRPVPAEVVLSRR